MSDLGEEAFLWTSSSGIEGLGILAGGELGNSPQSIAHAASPTALLLRAGVKARVASNPFDGPRQRRWLGLGAMLAKGETLTQMDR